MHSVKFTALDRYEISQGLSVVEITNPMMNVDFKMNKSLHDSRMGAFRNIPCDTCREKIDCPGHFGHITMTFPILNPMFIKTTLVRILALKFCYICYKKKCDCVAQTENKKKRKRNNIVLISSKMILDKTTNTRKQVFVRSDNNEQITQRDLYLWICNIPKEEYMEHFPSHFDKYTDLSDSVFIHNLPILPPIARPPNQVSGEWKPNPITMSYNKIMRTNIEIRLLNIDKTPALHIDEKMETLHKLISAHFNCNIKIDTDMDNKKTVIRTSTRARINGKQGYIRKNLQGKRCDFSARTVLSGDPNLGFNEVGVPRTIADNLTVPLTITPFNIELVRKKNYNIKYIHRKNVRYDLSIVNMSTLQIGDVIERSLIDGDIVAVNRQPTLHKGSMIACYVKIFDCSTLRLNYSTMVPLNADCDGDEINIHVPQDDTARAELETLMLPSTNIVSPQDSKPLLGCTQDSLLGCWKLSQALLTRNDMMSIIYSMDIDDLPKPTILKPTPMYSGISIVTSILNHIDVHISHYTNKDNTFEIKNNIVTKGVLDKQIIGGADKSLFHIIYLQKDHLTAAKAIHLFQKAATAFLDMHGFSIGISDCIVENVTPLQFDKLNKHLEDEMLRGDTTNEGLLCEALGKLTKLEATGVEDNSILDCIMSGSKGSIINFNQITRCVGQQNTDTGRIPHEFHGRTLPHFKKHESSIESRGFVKESFIQGLDPKSFFLHAVGGRVGLISTAVKTSVTGYAYRKMVKSMEPLQTRDIGDNKRIVKNTSTGGVVQFEYGEDSYDGTYLMS